MFCRLWCVEQTAASLRLAGRLGSYRCRGSVEGLREMSSLQPFVRDGFIIAGAAGDASATHQGHSCRNKTFHGNPGNSNKLSLGRHECV